MKKSRLCVLIFSITFCGAVFAQTPVPENTQASVMTELKGANIVAGKDNKMHLIVDGKRIGSIQFDPEWAKSKSVLSIIPPQYWEPPPKKPIQPRDPCIYASSGSKCLPDLTKLGPLIKWPNDIREIGVFTRK